MQKKKKKWFLMELTFSTREGFICIIFAWECHHMKAPDLENNFCLYFVFHTTLLSALKSALKLKHFEVFIKKLQNSLFFINFSSCKRLTFVSLNWWISIIFAWDVHQMKALDSENNFCQHNVFHMALLSTLKIALKLRGFFKSYISSKKHVHLKFCC